MPDFDLRTSDSQQKRLGALRYSLVIQLHDGQTLRLELGPMSVLKLQEQVDFLADLVDDNQEVH